MRHQNVKTALACSALAVIGTTGLGGCSKPEAPAPITIAVTASSHEPAPNLSGPVRDLLTRYAADALEPKQAVVQIVVQGRSKQEVDLTPRRGSDVEADSMKAADLIADNLDDLQTLLAKQSAATDGVDTIGVYDQALQVTPRGGRIIMISSGISTTAPTDLKKAGAWMLHPTRFVDRISRRDIPNAAGRRVIWTGLGYTDPDAKQPPAGTAARTALTTLWTHLCKTSRATSCTTIAGPAGTNKPAATNEVPVVTFDKVTTHCIGTITMSADIAFDSNSATLTSAADRILKPIANALVHCPPHRILNAYGHAAEVPGDGTGTTLSKARAINTLGRLRALGAPASVIGTATGYGNTSHQLVDNTPGGVYDESLARRNRVVELTITIR